MAPVHDHGNAEWALLAVGLRDIHTPHRHWVPSGACAVHLHRNLRPCPRRQGNLPVDASGATPGVALGDLADAEQGVRPGPQHHLLQRPGRGPVLLPRRLEDPAPQPRYVLLVGAPVDALPVEDVLGSVHFRVQLVPRFERLMASAFKGSPAHVSALSGPAVRPASGRFPHDYRVGATALCHEVPSPFGAPASASWASCPAGGLRPSCDRPTEPEGFGPRRGFHVPRTRDTTGVGAPYTPRPAVFPRPVGHPRSPLAASPSGQALSPGCSSRLPELSMTRHQRGFTHVRPSGLPLARSLPRTERGPLGVSPELRTPDRQDLPTHVRAGTDLEH